MGERTWFRRRRRQSPGGARAVGKAKRGDARSGYVTRHLAMEPLEDRRVLATFVVTNLLDLDIDDDPEPGSLREAIEMSNDEDDQDIILFAEGLTGTILLNGGQLDIEEEVSIIAASGKIAVQADARSRIFDINIGDDEDAFNVEISGLVLVGGNTNIGDIDERRGGAIWNRENLFMRETILTANSADNGGGAIYHQFGELFMDRCHVGVYAGLVFGSGNLAGGIGGGGILIGEDAESDDTDNIPTATIINSSFSGNAATSTTAEEGYGGAIFNRRGFILVGGNTIIGNSVGNEAGEGAGIASWGNPPAEVPEDPMEEPPDPPPPTVETEIEGNIIFGNGDEQFDISVVGPPDEEAGEEPVPLLTSVTNNGGNDIGLYGNMVMPAATDISEDPLLLAGTFGEPLDFGGSMPVYYPDTDSPVIDKGGEAFSFNEQRGAHFLREFGNAVDIGAVEVQQGTFVVDVLRDEADGIYTSILPGGFGFDPYVVGSNFFPGDFTLREAFQFSEKNPEIDTIGFKEFRGDLFNPDPTISPAITIRLTLGEIVVFSSVVVAGPDDYVLEIDSSGSDPTPLVNNADGARVFNIDNGNTTARSDIEIGNLAFVGGDTTGAGGAIFSRENLTMRNVTFSDNFASNNGGALWIQHGDLSITTATINGNRAGANGGGIYIEPGPTQPVVELLQVTISGNEAAARGGAIINNNGNLTIEYSTISNNTGATQQASGIENHGANAKTALRSTIVSGNGILGGDVNFFAQATANGFTSQGYNFIGGGNASARFNQTGDKSGLNPLLAPLSNTGGRMLTHRPLVGSPVIDMGDPAAKPGMPAPQTDQRGGTFTRVFDGDMDGVARIDIGAYELQPSVLLVDSPFDASDGNFGPGNFSLREAIEISNQNPLTDTIRFDPDLDSLSIGGASTGTLTVTDSVIIEGTGSAELRVVAGQVADLQLADKIFTIDDGKAGFIDVRISGMTITGAQIGAMFSRENVTFDDVTFISNRSTTSGGAITHELGSFKMTNSLVTGNATTTAGADGGALYFNNVNSGRKIEFDYVTISGNSTSMTGGDGGAIFAKNSVIEGRQVTISGNATLAGATDGGGAYFDGVTALLETGTISGNTTVGANSQGAGLVVAGASNVTLTKNSLIGLNVTIGSNSAGAGAYVTGGTLTIDNSNIVQNSTTGLNAPGGAIAIESGGSVVIIGTAMFQNRTAGEGGNGGVVANLGGNLSVRNSAIYDNFVTHPNSRGGGIYSDTDLVGHTTSIVNSTISGNSAPLRGGGVFNADGRTEIRHSTITNNFVPLTNVGSGVASQGSAGTLTVVQSSIIAGNVGASTGAGTDVDFVDAAFINSFQSLGFNVIGVGNAAANFVQTGDKTGVTNPLLGQLAENGGFTRTHALLPGSLAINAGSPGFNPNSFAPPLTSDQRGVGFARVLGGRIDAGAFESALTSFTADFDGDNDVDGGDYIVWQRNVGLLSGATRAQGDANGDGAVNAADLSAWKSQFGANGSQVAVLPAIVSGGTDAPAAAAVVANSADDSPSVAPRPAAGEITSLAGTGLPTPGARAPYRPAPRAAASQGDDVAQSSRLAAFAGWRGRTIDATAAVAARLRHPADAESVEDTACDEAAFASLAEGQF